MSESDQVPGDDGFHDPEDAFVTRDADDNIAPVEAAAPGVGKVLVRPMVYGDVEKHFGDAGRVEQAGPETIAEIIRGHIVKPDYEAFAKEHYREKVQREVRAESGSDTPTHYLVGSVVRDEMKPLVPQALLSAIMDASGIDASVDMDDEGTATIEFGEEGN